MSAASTLYIYVLQVRCRVRFGREEEERDEGIDGDTESVAERAQEEPVSDQRGEDHAGDHHEDDVDAGVDVVCERQEAIEKGEQDDLGAQEQDGRRRRGTRLG